MKWQLKFFKEGEGFTLILKILLGDFSLDEPQPDNRQREKAFIIQNS